ncbi:MAG: outer membrane protein assembly factor BamA [Rhodobacteraceae bacterium]|nr:outer membrane protein assembly factor BamA [Paracoccaceae bacterium]
MHHERGARKANGFGRGVAAALLRIFAVVAIGLMTLGAAQAASYTFSSVQVDGLQRIETGTVLTYAAIPKGKPVTDGDLNDAYQRIVNSGLFESVDMQPAGARLVIKVKEFPTINVINFEGNKRLKSEDLAKLLKSQSRRVYSPSTAEADAAAITEAYRQTKRYAAIVTPKIIPRSENRVDLVFDIQEGGTVEVQRLSFIGNRTFSDHRLREVLATKQVGFLHQFFSDNTFAPDRLAVDEQQLTDFYHSRGFIDFRLLDANAQIDRERKGFFLTFMIQEGQPYTFAKTYATTTLKDVDLKDFQAQIHIRPGVTYSPTIIDDTVTRMENEAIRKGLNFIRVTPQVIRNNKDLSLDVNFVVDRGPKIFIERIDIEGNGTTQDRVIRRQFHASEGDPFNPREIKAASDRIKALGFFKDVQVNPQQGDTPDQAVVNVTVQEQPTGSLSIGGTYGVDSGFGVALNFSEANFLGRGQYVSADINTTSSDRASSFSFIEPALFGRDLAFKLNAGYTTSTHSYATYDTSLASFSPAIEFPVSARGRLELRYSVGRNIVRNFDTDTSTIITSEGGGRTYSSLGYTYSYDTNRDGLSPKSSMQFQFGQDFAGLGGSAKYIASTAKLSAQTKIVHESVTLRAQLEGGLIALSSGQDNTVADRYFLNGKLIGFKVNGIGPRDTTTTGNDALGGNTFAVARLEAVFPLGLPEDYGLNGGVFLNAGSVWNLKDTYGVAVDDGFHLRAAMGFSLYWTTPIGPLRFDFSRAIKKMPYDQVQNFNLTIATKF